MVRECPVARDGAVEASRAPGSLGVVGALRDPGIARNCRVSERP